MPGSGDTAHLQAMFTAGDVRAVLTVLSACRDKVHKVKPGGFFHYKGGFDMPLMNGVEAAAEQTYLHHALSGIRSDDTCARLAADPRGSPGAQY